MITLVIGKPKSGKSELAEEMAVKGDYKNRYYVATMKVMDPDGSKRVDEHRKRREGKGFVTLEIPMDIGSAVNFIEDPMESVVLLECVANLTGNWMHGIPNTMWLMEQGDVGRKEFVKSLTEKISSLSKKVCDMIVVTTEYEPEDSDDEETALYKELLAGVNEELTRIADKVVRK